MSTTAVEPHNLEAEESVLGACFLAESAVDVVSEFLEPSHFYREGHGSIYGAMLALRRRHDPIEPLIISAELERMGVLEKVGGNSRLQVLAASAVSASNVAHYAALVLEAARSRGVYRAALAVEKAAQNGGLAHHPELLDEMRRALDEAAILPGEPGIPEGPVFLSAHEFAASQFEPPEPLLGTADTAVIAAGSLNLLAGRPGTGKTTLILDLACHLAAGLDWPPAADDSSSSPAPWPCPRPLNVALIENEGPQAMFAAKLQDKLERFPHSVREAGGSLMIQTWRWGSFSFADRDTFSRVQHELDERMIDLVIGDPLLSLGPEGVGSPRETSDFVQLLRPLGLGTHRAFLFLHHFRERTDKTEDELSRLSGAWGGHLDTLLTLASTGRKDHARIAYPKLRWSRGELPDPIILGKVFNTLSFEGLAEESDPGLLEPAAVGYLEELRATEKGRGEQGWATVDEIAKAIGNRRVEVEKCLEGAQHLFQQASPETKKTVKAKHNAKLWGLIGWQEATLEDELENPTQTSLADPPPDDGIPF